MLLLVSMKKTCFFFLVLVLILSGCVNVYVNTTPQPFLSNPPEEQNSPRQQKTQSITLAATAKPGVNQPTQPAQPNANQSQQQTGKPNNDLAILVRACDTGIDLVHGLGEVTNAYVTLQNRGASALTDLLVSLTAPDEDREHPNKTARVEALPSGFEISLKLTVDTRTGNIAGVQINAGASGGVQKTVQEESCRKLVTGSKLVNSLELGKVRPIQE